MSIYLVQSYLDARREAHPKKAALVDAHGVLTYEKVYEVSSRLARFLKAQGVKRQDRVVIYQERSATVVLSIIGVLKADAIYIPVDAKTPGSRLEKIIKDCQPTAIICDGRRKKEIEALGTDVGGSRSIVVLADVNNIADKGFAPNAYLEEMSGQFDANPEYQNIDTDAACILYTSGSTGNPKGVVISHRNILSYIDWAVDCFGIGSDDRILCTAPFHFDMSTFDIYASFAAGATLCIAPDQYLLFPNKLLDMMEKEKITIWKGVSSLLMYLSATSSLKENRIPSLRIVLFGGEVLPTKHLIRWMETFPKKKFYNVYGPTEATGISAYYPVETIPANAGEPVPIGKACANTEIFLMTGDDRVAEVGETGELCIRGSGLSTGYWKDPGKTERSFVPNPLGENPNDRMYRTGDLGRMRPDGNLEYLGRKDFQVKFMGYRIELHEIEKALLSLGKIDQTVVLLCEYGCNDMQELVAFVEGPAVTEDTDLLRDLTNLLPPYMIPRRLIRMEKIPLNDRGKTDRDVLRAHYRILSQAHA